MDKQRIKEMHHRMHKSVEMMIETLEELEKNADNWTGLMYLSDILKDMSEVEKNIVKAERP